jgi:hypothetical protein
MDFEKLIPKLIQDYPCVDSSLIHAIAHEASSEAVIRETLDVLGADAQFETPDWKLHETRDLENALADAEEDFSLIEFHDGKLSFKHEDCTNDENELEDDDFDDHIKKNNLDLSTKADLAKLYRLYPMMSKDKIKTVFIENRYIVDNTAEELLSLDAAERFQREEDQLEKHMEHLQLAKHKKNPSGPKLRGKRRPKQQPSDFAKNVQYIEKVYKLSEKEAADLLEEYDFSMTQVISYMETLSQTNKWSSVASSQVPPPTVSYAQLVPSMSMPPERNTPVMSKKVAQQEVEINNKMSNAYREKAMAAFAKSKSNPLYRQVAGYYSEQSQKYNTQKHVALDSQFAHIAEKQTQSHCIDLHGLPLHFAVTVAIEKLYQWWQIETHHVQQTGKAGGSMSTLKRTTKPLKIITGAGRHSAANIPKIKNAVRKKLVEERWKFQEFDSYFLVSGVL